MSDDFETVPRGTKERIADLEAAAGLTIVDYTVIGSCGMKYLVEGVAEHIADGWQPLGGVSLAYERNIQRSVDDKRFLAEDFEHYAQALVKYE